MLIKTKIKYYRYELDKPQDNKEYKLLCENLKNKGLKLFDAISLNNYQQKTEHFNKIKELEQRGFIELDTTYLFNNQWNTTEESFNLRVFNWYEEIYPNKQIKEGYYLEITEEMKNLLKNTFSCGYCGKQYFKPKQEFCLNCLDSEFLKKEDLFLLRLRSVKDEDRRTKDLTPTEQKNLIKLYTQAQTKGNKERAIKKIEDLKKRYKEDLKQAQTEYKGFMWLLERGINTDNCIYYNHSNLFTFGWRTLLSFEIEQELKKQLKEFPFKYELKTQ